MSLFKNIKKRIGWYPVSTIGWILTFIYTVLLIHVVLKINADLYNTDFIYYSVSVLLIAAIAIVCLWAKFTGEKPFYEGRDH